MTPKELQYVEDALSHEQFLLNQCRQAASALTDPELKQCASQLAGKHQEVFDRFFRLV